MELTVRYMVLFCLTKEFFSGSCFKTTPGLASASKTESIISYLSLLSAINLLISSILTFEKSGTEIVSP